ncbi:hypothetical protein FB468_0680 [Leucobacter komagatae]|uniref:Transcriptional regulator with AbiEi antitoxin domain of type IV toxin-antitoxin system n=1 Tax=Leucobacter komagatae TaxID=55969 RepID=A0A542Y3L6_9MICO|nr:hypothetical protein [Leucobacter komagatae]TQL42675.1 hypothetical protein FB468_0680 [Leucobacter komagatae]
MATRQPPRVDHWPPALRSAAVLSGTLVRSGPGYRAVSWPDGPRARVASIAGLLGENFIAAEDTAAWVWGVRRSPGSPLQLLTRHGRAPATFELGDARGLVRVSAYRFAPGDIDEVAGHGVTSPVRTAYDLLRSKAPLTVHRRVACRLLSAQDPTLLGSLTARAAGASLSDGARVRRRLRELGQHARAP